jgi:hypothetical protein
MQIKPEKFREKQTKQTHEPISYILDRTVLHSKSPVSRHATEVVVVPSMVHHPTNKIKISVWVGI